MTRTALAYRILLTVLSLLLALAIGCADDGRNGRDGADGADGAQGPPGDPGGEPVTALEACVGCHGDTGVVPVGNIDDGLDAHFTDRDPDGPLTASGYRLLEIDIVSVSIAAGVIQIDFQARARDEFGTLVDVTDLFAADGRFTIARLNPGSNGDADTWESLITRTEQIDDPPIGPGTTPALQANSERFSTGTFCPGDAGCPVLPIGAYRYTSNLAGAVLNGDTMRVAIQISAGDLPAGNGWCDFVQPNTACTGPFRVSAQAPTLTRDIVQTATCNGCHGATSDTQLAIHGGGRTDVEYCVTCHNPGTTDANSGNTLDFPVLIHKIHYGSSLTEPDRAKIWGFNDNLHDYSTVSFTKDIDDCTVCHTGGGADEANWNMVPTQQACGSCHDYLISDTGQFGPQFHSFGGQQADNSNCAGCHPPSGGSRAIQTAHRGVARSMEGALYAGANGFNIEDVTYNPSGRQLTVEYSVARDGARMNLETDDEWTAGGGSRLVLVTAWDTDDYTNENSGSTPALPISVDALDVGGAVTDLGFGFYETTVSLPSSATSGTVTVGLEGHPAADLDLDGTFGESQNRDPAVDELQANERIAVKNAFAHFDVVQRRTMTLARRQVIDMDKCNLCHDAAGNGLSLHGNNRTAEDQVCVLCHNANMTDINRRPDPPAMTADGKLEEVIDFKRMIHQIHTGAELEDGLVIYGFGGSVNDFSHVEFIGNRANCETCHLPGTYSIEDAANGLPTTVDTGADEADPDDDLNISQMASVCSSCHDDAIATDHMKLNGAAFNALDEDIH